MHQNLSPAADVGDDRDVKRDVVIRLLVTQAERDAMQAAADDEGLTLSEWIRRRCIRTTTTVEVTEFWQRRSRQLSGNESHGAPLPKKPTKKGGK